MSDTIPMLGALFEPPAGVACPGPAPGANAILYSGPGRLVGWAAFVLPQGAATTSTPVANPAAGADWAFTVPANTTLALTSVVATLTASAAVANRIPALVVTDSTGRTVVDAVAQAATVASGATVYTWGVSEPDTGLVNGEVSTNTPPVTLGPGWTVKAVTAGIQAGDQWSAVDVGTTGPSGATATLIDGLDTTGLVVASVGGLAGATDSDSFGPFGIQLRRGLFIVGNASVSLAAAYVVPQGRGR